MKQKKNNEYIFILPLPFLPPKGAGTRSSSIAYTSFCSILNFCYRASCPHRGKVAEGRKGGIKKTPTIFMIGVWNKKSGDDLLSHGLLHTIIGAERFHF